MQIKVSTGSSTNAAFLEYFFSTRVVPYSDDCEFFYYDPPEICSGHLYFSTLFNRLNKFLMYRANFIFLFINNCFFQLFNFNLLAG